MPTFAVMLRGENFEMEMEGAVKRLGFFTTRFVRARNEGDAERLAVKMVRDHERLQAALHRNGYTSMIYLESIELKPWWYSFKKRHGFAFWDMDKEELGNDKL